MEENKPKKKRKIPTGSFIARYTHPIQKDKRSDACIDLFVNFERYWNTSAPLPEIILTPIFDRSVVRDALRAPNLSPSLIIIAVPYANKANMSDAETHNWIYRHTIVHQRNAFSYGFLWSGLDVSIVDLSSVENTLLTNEPSVNGLKKLQNLCLLLYLFIQKI